MSQKTSSLVGLGIAGSMFAMAPSSADAAPKAYVGNFTNNTASVIDTSTGSVVATIPVAGARTGMAMSPGGGGDATYTVDYQQPLLWRAEAQSAVHDRKHLALCHLRERDRPAAWVRTANASLRRPRVAISFTSGCKRHFQPS
jgi:YVTN family beta-propeller protein